MMNPQGGGAPFPPIAPAIRQGMCFRYTVPAGWQVLEDGPFAVALMAPDQLATTVLVGNSGLPIGMPPHQFLFDKLSQLSVQQLQFGPPRPARPVFGWPMAWEFDATYGIRGIPCCGIARCSVAPAYDSCSMVMTWAASERNQWAGYRSWLPEIAAQVEITSPAAFGAAGIARQNLQNSMAVGEHARRNREWSERQWAQVAQQRDDAQARNAFEFRQALDGVQRYENPYDHRPVDLPTSSAVYWVNLNTGQILGSPDPGFDPRTAQDAHWQPMTPSRPGPGTA